MATTFQKVANNAVSTLATTMNTSVTSVVVQSGEGALFPASGSFHITIESEILICTSRSGDTLTVSRAAESTSAASHTEGSQVALNIISKHISDLNTAVNAVETVLATSGGLRGNLSDETGTGGAVFATEPTLTSPVLNTGVSGSAISTDVSLGTSNTLLSTQGAVKSYVDTRIATEDTIAELNDTNISSPAAGHILVYDNTASVWDNVALSGGDGLTATLGDGTLALALDLKSNGGAVIESNELAVDLGASSITGTLAVGDGGTGATTLNNLITMGTHTQGNYVATVTAGTGLTSTGGTSGESIAHSLSVDASQGQITTVGTLNAGSIDTSFGTINNAAAITGTVLTATTNFTMGDTVVTNGVITDSSGLSLAADVTVTGDLIVNGDTVTVNTATLSVEDPLIALATGNGADSVDVGLYAKYTDSGVKYSGLFRDASDSDKWKLFATTGGSHAAPTTTVNTTSGFTLGTLVASAFEGDITGDVTGNADTATLATTVTASANNSTDATFYPTFVDGATGAQSIETDTGLTYNSSTGVLTSTTFTGNLTGNVTGNADTVTTNANLTGDVTSSGNAASIASNVIVNADVNSSAAIAYSKLAALSDGNILVGNGSNVATSVNPSGDVDVSNAGVFSIASGVIVDADVNASAAIAVSKTALVAGTNITLATNTLNVDDAFLKNDASDTTTGTITAAGFTVSDDSDIKLGEAGKVNFVDVAPDDGEATGVVLSFIADVTLAVGDLVYIVADGSDGKVGKADANQVTTMPAIGVAVTGVSADAPVEVLVQGLLRRNSAYGFTIGQDLFVSAAAVGGVTATAPSGSGDTVQKVGVALHADIAYYNFNTTEVLLA